MAADSCHSHPCVCVCVYAYMHTSVPNTESECPSSTKFGDANKEFDAVLNLLSACHSLENVISIENPERIKKNKHNIYNEVQVQHCRMMQVRQWCD